MDVTENDIYLGRFIGVVGESSKNITRSTLNIGYAELVTNET